MDSAPSPQPIIIQQPAPAAAPPAYVPPPPDPVLAQLQQQSENQNVQALQGQATSDTARIARQYGIRSVLGGGAGGASLATPLVPPVAAAGSAAVATPLAASPAAASPISTALQGMLNGGAFFGGLG